MPSSHRLQSGNTTLSRAGILLVLSPLRPAAGLKCTGYNVWYTRDEFHNLWKKLPGDGSLAADVSFPDAAVFGDRKAVLVICQDLEDDSKEALVALHGRG